MYTIKEVADIFKVSQRTVRRWLASGKIQKIKNIGSVRITQEEINKFIKGE